MRRLLLVFSCLLVSAGLIAAQTADPHFQTPKVAPTVQRSAFVHGYLHGYEEGFHQADFHLHMGRVSRGEYVRDDKPAGYRKEFGSKKMFESGYREGFRVGYGDGVSDRSFRAIENVLGAAAADPGNAPATAAFDEGIQSGYVAGQHQGLDDARRQAENRPSPACPVSEGKLQPEFCNAYARGYGMGYADGFTNQAKTAIAEAKQQ